MMSFSIPKRNTKTICLSLLAILGSINYNCFAQQPGGVSGTKLWYVTESIGNKNVLKDISGNHKAAFDSSFGEKNLNLNFHPATYSFEDSSQLNFKNFAFNQGTVIGIFYPDEDNYQSANYFIGIQEKGKKVVVKNNSIDTSKQHGFEKKYEFGRIGKRNLFDLEGENADISTSMKTLVYYKASKKVYSSIWEEDKSINLFNYFNGYIPELIIYNRVLSALEKSKVESYLAIKYGTTLDNSYIGSNGNILWDFNDPTLKSFHNRIIAIGKDLNAGLIQPRSTTTYEEKPYFSYKHGAIIQTPFKRGYKFIPSTDSTSLFRSLTIGFPNKLIETIEDKSFLFFADDSKEITYKSFIVDSLKYKGMRMVNRTWLCNNQQKIKAPTKITLAGNKYTDKNLFGNIYEPYDYQLYRYVLIRLKDTTEKKIDTSFLCNYFGREQEENSVKFNTRTIVWESVIWQNEKDYSYFTFGKVPILNFLSVKNIFNSQNKLLQYPYYEDSAIRAETNFDTTTLIYNYKPEDSVLKFSFKTSVGVGALAAKLFLINSLGRDTLLPLSFIKSPSAVIDSSKEENHKDTTENIKFEIQPHSEDNPSNSPSNHKAKINYIIRTVAPDKQKFIEFQVAIPLKKGLTLKSIFLIEVTDEIGQKTTLPIKIKPASVPLTN